MAHVRIDPATVEADPSVRVTAEHGPNAHRIRIDQAHVPKEAALAPLVDQGSVAQAGAGHVHLVRTDVGAGAIVPTVDDRTDRC